MVYVDESAPMDVAKAPTRFVRLDDELYQRLAALAKAERRTITAQVRVLLERALPEQDGVAA